MRVRWSVAVSTQAKTGVKKSIRIFCNPNRILPGAIFQYNGKRFVVKGTRNKIYFQTEEDPGQKILINKCKLIEHNEGMVFLETTIYWNLNFQQTGNPDVRSREFLSEFFPPVHCTRIFSTARWPRMDSNSPQFLSRRMYYIGWMRNWVRSWAVDFLQCEWNRPLGQSMI